VPQHQASFRLLQVVVVYPYPLCDEQFERNSNSVDTVPVFRLRVRIVSLRNREKQFAEISKQQIYTIIQ
jgi:hypothetical protein